MPVGAGSPQHTPVYVSEGTIKGSMYKSTSDVSFFFLF